MKLEEKVEKLSEEIEKETDTNIHKDKQHKRSQWKKFVKQIREDFILRQVKYKEQKEIFGNRNSYSKTDKDATFMRMKEDHMKNVKKRNSSIYISNLLFTFISSIKYIRLSANRLTPIIMRFATFILHSTNTLDMRINFSIL